MRFYAPANPLDVSHSIVNLQRTEQYFEAPCRGLDSLLKEHAQAHLDLLKLDIEGAEIEVIYDLLRKEIYPTILAVGFDQPAPWSDVRRTIKSLRGCRYELVAVDHWSYTFIRHQRGAFSREDSET